MLSSGPDGMAAYLPSGPQTKLHIHDSALKVILHFMLSLSLSVQDGTVSAAIKFSKNISVSHAVHRGPNHQTRGSSTELFGIIPPSQFPASAKMVWMHLHWMYQPLLQQMIVQSHSFGPVSK